MRHLKILLLLFLFLPVVLTAQEDDWYLSKPIIEIRFDGLSSVSENELLGLVRPYLGKLYSDSLSWEIQSKLYALDYFDIIIPEILPADSDPERLILVFQVQEKPVVNDVQFVGNSKVRKGELTDAVLVKTGDLLNPGTLRIDEQAIIDYYLEKGFIEATVTSGFTLNEQTNSVVVVFTIVEGSQTKISEIRFVGNDKQFSNNALQNLMKTKPQSLFNKGLYVETKLQEDLKAIESFYGDQGFIDVKILDVNKEIVLDPEQNVKKMIITIVIQEGELWTYGGMTFVGNRIYSVTELAATVLQVPGKVFSSTKFQQDYQRISDMYYENGYIFNNFNYEEKRDIENRVISYVVQILERDRAHIEDIIIRGNDKTKTYIIQREIPLEEGEVFSKAKIIQGISNLYNLQYFDVVEPQPTPGSSDGLMDLIVDVSEGKTSDIGFGISFSGGPDFPISGQLNWNDKNFLGRGQILGAEINVSPDIQSLTFRFTEPRILGLRWSGGVDLSWTHDVSRRINQDLDGNGLPDPYNTWQEYDAAGRVVPEDYQMEYKSHYLSTGVNTGYVWPIKRGRIGLSGGLRFSWEYVNYDPSVYRPQSEDIRENLYTWQYDDSVSLRTAWDTRDAAFDTTRGFILSENITYAGLLPSSRRDYIKSVSRLNYAHILFNVPVNDKGGAFKGILDFNTAFQALFDKPWSETQADPQRDGFYIDGMFVARGWDPESGYQYLWNNTLQFKFPLVNKILAFDVFFDAVGAWVATNGDYSTSNALLNMHISDWRFSIGAGFRFANPQFPIGIYIVKKFKWDIFGNINWNPEPNLTEFDNWGLDLVIAFNMDIY